MRSVDGVEYYQVGSGQNGLLFVPDVWGWNGGRIRALADDFAKKGLSCWVPKILQPAFEGGTDGDGLPPSFNPAERGSEFGPLFGDTWNHAKVMPKLKSVMKCMKSSGVKKIGVLGFCYGGWIGMYLAKEGGLVACASCHPSIHIEGMTGGDPAALAKESKCAWALFPAGEASAGGDPDMYDADGAVMKALEEKFPGKNVTKRFSKMAHGFVTRGDIKDTGNTLVAGKGEEVKAAVAECVNDVIEFFCKKGLMRRDKAGLPRPPPKLKKPKFIQVKDVQPEGKGVNLMLKAVKCEENADKGSWEAVLGDSTGTVTFLLRSAELAALCAAGSSVRVQNARVLMQGGYIRVIIDKWAVLKAADEPVDFEPKTSNNISAVEYELA